MEAKQGLYTTLQSSISKYRKRIVMNPTKFINNEWTVFINNLIFNNFLAKPKRD